ncbi:hypothetical protein [Adlercreutzia sp. ZJ242]|uniref:hypothetical protein n=1 Tax=Adlercreutzia sp. ZJ242 TaxID=2709409 RepID=UPI0013EE27FE|nr:hypothetical protein [Adlercreutzia sp. ZJ242]
MSKENGEERSAAPWILVSITVDLKGEREPMAQVRTPDGDKEVPLSEAKGKVNVFEQLPEYKKKELARKLLAEYKEWKAGQEANPPQQIEGK